MPMLAEEQVMKTCLLDSLVTDLNEQYPVQGQTRANIPDRPTALRVIHVLNTIAGAKAKKYRDGSTVAEHVDGAWADGFRTLGTVKKGIVNKPVLHGADGAWYELSPDMVAYATLLAEQQR
jgi:hypothetical protein